MCSCTYALESGAEFSCYELISSLCLVDEQNVYRSYPIPAYLIQAISPKIFYAAYQERSLPLGH